jgi:hypothetical protein
VERSGLYVRETTLYPALRFDQHKTGYKASQYVNGFGVRLLSQLFDHFNPLRRWGSGRAGTGAGGGVPARRRAVGGGWH